MVSVFAIEYYRNKEYTDPWIEVGLKGILNRKKLTDVWKDNRINENYEYAMLNNEIYKTWSFMKANEYKKFKGIRKEYPKGLNENLKVAKRGGNVSKIAREIYELETGNRAITSDNAIGRGYIDYKE